jgi:ornithine cyclodeaminase
LLIIGAGVQGRSHLEAFVQVVGVREVFIASRSIESANALAEHARSLGATAHIVNDVSQALPHCPLVVTCTPARAIVLDAMGRADHFISAVGAFTPSMAEIGIELCREIASCGRIVLDSADARHEAGDLLQASIELDGLPLLRDALDQPRPVAGPVLFKSCGWAGWDLAAARLARRLALHRSGAT